MGQRYAAAARSGSMPRDSGVSWPRSVMHGPDKHRSLFEAFAGLQRDSAHGVSLTRSRSIKLLNMHNMESGRGPAQNALYLSLGQQDSTSGTQGMTVWSRNVAQHKKRPYLHGN